jgi:8-amino-7-oxononanoate synthase
MTTLTRSFIDKFDQRKQLSLYRLRHAIAKRKGAKWQYNDQPLLSFMNNDYLGLANHPKVIHALQKSAAYYGVGSSASQLLGGYYVAHQILEEKLSEFLGVERALIFSSGFMANLAVLSTLINNQDYVFEDRLNHASLIDGVRYSHAQVKRYRRDNLLDLETRITQAHSKNKWIVTEGVFGMDGDIAPLPQLFELAKNQNCHLLIDDAHGIGVLGENGKGSIEHYQLSVKNVSILVGTFGKAFGTMGAFVAGNHILMEALMQFGRSFIYTTALPPAIASATCTSLELIQTEDWRREHLQFLVQYFKKSAYDLNLPLSSSITPIQTLITGKPESAFRMMELLKKKGILIGCIRPPTVPLNTSRLRINLNVNHTQNDVEFLLESLSTVWKKHIEHESDLQ